MVKRDAWIEVLPDEQVSVVECGGVEADQDLLWSGFWYGDIFQLEAGGGRVSFSWR